MANEVEVLGRSMAIARLPHSARDQRLPGKYKELYNQLLNQGLQEFPPIEGYETMHVMMLERLTYFFVKQKEDEDQPSQTFDLRRYRTNFIAFTKTCESLLKEARSISAEVAFKHNFIRQVMEVIDRTIPDAEQKRNVAQELSKIATA